MLENTSSAPTDFSGGFQCVDHCNVHSLESSPSSALYRQISQEFFVRLDQSDVHVGEQEPGRTGVVHDVDAGRKYGSIQQAPSIFHLMASAVAG